MGRMVVAYRVECTVCLFARNTETVKARQSVGSNAECKTSVTGRQLRRKITVLFTGLRDGGATLSPRNPTTYYRLLIISDAVQFPIL